ncbi:hypothetical protein ACEZDB_13520 [Streptacidiphilus sp. N1-3]|uniref:Uncharacterized protein n=1 Tax=Streptacidiphilus alkalitolerans TaxID=3342712 RepID=A0ABV6X0D0_9ACTN
MAQLPYPAHLIPDVSAGMLAHNDARAAAAQAGRVAVSIQLQRGAWSVKMDTRTAPAHSVRESDALALAEAVTTLVRCRVAVTGTCGPGQYGLVRLAGEEEARSLAAAMHAAVYGDPTGLKALTAELCAARGRTAEGTR